jgi:hypothetical protein
LLPKFSQNPLDPKVIVAIYTTTKHTPSASIQEKPQRVSLKDLLPFSFLFTLATTGFLEARAIVSRVTPDSLHFLSSPVALLYFLVACILPPKYVGHAPHISNILAFFLLLFLTFFQIHLKILDGSREQLKLLVQAKKNLVF